MLTRVFLLGQYISEGKLHLCYVKDGSFHARSISYHYGVDSNAKEDLVKWKGFRSMQRLNRWSCGVGQDI